MDTVSKKQVAGWLFVCCAMIFLIVVVGGATRLTQSGLSMTEWQPLVGAIPPLNDEQWSKVFEKYQQTPEYLKINRGMSIEEFKGIFWWEYFHRLLGRSIGVVFLLPFLYFLARRKIDASLVGRFALIFVLGAVQGGLGWYMVRSGLIDDPRVSPYRLTAHLGLAFLIYAAILRTALQLLSPALAAPHERYRRPRVLAAALAGLIFLMVLSGGIVAGTRAGFVYNTFPLMDGQWIPQGVLTMQPWYLNFFENILTIQFDHRLIAALLVLLVPLFWLYLRQLHPPQGVRSSATFLLGMLVFQVSLGIGTLLQGVPVLLAVSHQAGALLLFTACVLVHQQLRRI